MHVHNDTDQIQTLDAPIQDQTIIYPRFIMLQSRRDYYTSPAARDR